MSAFSGKKRWVVTLGAAIAQTACASGPDIQQTAYTRPEPTEVRSLLIVVDDKLFWETSNASKGARFAHMLGDSLRNTAGAVPVTLLQIDSPQDAGAFPHALLSSDATQLVVIRATRVTTNLRDLDSATWDLNVSNVSRSAIPFPSESGKYGTRVTTHPIYCDQITSNVDDASGLVPPGHQPFAEQMGMTIAAQLRARHVLTPNTTPDVTPSSSSLADHIDKQLTHVAPHAVDISTHEELSWSERNL